MRTYILVYARYVADPSSFPCTVPTIRPRTVATLDKPYRRHSHGKIRELCCLPLCSCGCWLLHTSGPSLVALMVYFNFSLEKAAPPRPCRRVRFPNCRVVLGAAYRDASTSTLQHDTKHHNSYPTGAEWPGDNLETDLPASVLGRLLEGVSRPYTVAESRNEGSGAPNVSERMSRDGYGIGVRV